MVVPPALSALTKVQVHTRAAVPPGGRHARAGPAWSAGLIAALGWALPLSCSGCSAPDEALCDSCLTRAAHTAPDPFDLPDGTRVFAGSSYAGETRLALVAYKTEGLTLLDRRLALLLAPSIQEAVEHLRAVESLGPAARWPAALRPSALQPVALRPSALQPVALRPSALQPVAVRRRRPALLVPVPTSRRGFRARGYRPVDRVLGRVRDRGGGAPTCGLAYATQPLDQIGLGREERAGNMAGTMRCTRRFEGRDVVLVDDVCTTGATLGEAARAVRAAGARRVVAAVIAATPLRSLGAQPAQTASDFSGPGDYGVGKGVEEPPELSGGTPYRGGRCGN